MAGYIGTQPVPQATQTRDAFTCTAGQTSFATSGYTPGFLDVHLNGIKLAAADYTASNGSDVVLASGAALDDILEVVAYTSFEVVTDTVTNAGTVLNLDRTGSDGTILDLKKDGTTVGSIGTGLSGGSEFGIKSNTGELQLASSYNSNTVTWDGSQLYPSASNDLGASSVKWRDLYLSGGVFLGGVGSANKLDDYEEGTWTPAVSKNANLTGTESVTHAYYVKVGNLVHISVRVTGLSITSTGVETSFISNLPFSMIGTGGTNAVSGSCFWSAPRSNGGVVDLTSGNDTQVFIFLTPELTTSSGSADLTYSLTYRSS